MQIRGHSIEQPGSGEDEQELLFWGEWEPESVVERLDQSANGSPRWLHTPYYVRPNGYSPNGHVLQNTDPFVFGERFLYTLCRQWRQATNSPTLLRDLSGGSLILFGSLKDGEFVLDTVFVVADGVLHDSSTWANELEGRVSETYLDVTIRPTYEWGTNPELRLYSGATYEESVNGMFSFVPCRPAQAPVATFARPPIRLDGFVTPGLMMGFKTARDVPVEQVRELWEEVVEQVSEHDLALGTRFDLPPRRDD